MGSIFYCQITLCRYPGGYIAQCTCTHRLHHLLLFERTLKLTKSKILRQELALPPPPKEKKERKSVPSFFMLNNVVYPGGYIAKSTCTLYPPPLHQFLLFERAPELVEYCIGNSLPLLHPHPPQKKKKKKKMFSALIAPARSFYACSASAKFKSAATP